MANVPIRLSIILVVTLLICTSSSAQDRQPPPHTAPAMAPKGRNVLLIVGDDIGGQELYGFVKGSSKASTVPAENIAKLRKAGVTFTSAWAFPTCSPSRAALLTGLWAQKVGILKPEDVPEQLKACDPITAGPCLPSGTKLLPGALPPEVVSGLFGKWHLSNTGADPVTLGFDRFVGFLGGGVPSYFEWEKYDSRTPGTTTTDTDYTTSFFVRETLAWIKEQESSKKRWFAEVAFNAAHATEPDPPGKWDKGDLSKECVIVPKETAPSETKVYELQIRCLDAEIGRLLDGLRAIPSKPLENTTIIFLGDNGTPGKVAEPPLDSTRAKGTVYQGGVHVPLIICDGRYLTRPLPIPGNPPPAPQLGSVRNPGRSVGSPVHVVDLYPTIREIISGVGGTSAGDGVSLNVFLSGSSMPSVARKAILTANCHTNCTAGGDPCEKPTGMAAATDGRWKLIRQCDPKTKKYSAFAFYDLETDPWENTDLLPKKGKASWTPDLETAYSSLDSFLISFGY